MNDLTQKSPTKNYHKITSKGYGNTIQEVKIGKEETKKYRRNSAHNFSNMNKAGFYMY